VRLHRAGHDPERGAALILAIAVMLFVGLVSAGLMSYVITSVSARVSLDQTRNRQYAADAAVEYAVASVRGLASPGPGQAACGGPYTPPALANSPAMRVDCANNSTLAFNATTATFYLQRNVVFTACEASVPTVPCPEGDVIVRAQVNYEVPPGASAIPIRTYVQAWSVNR
jgi:Tfp pilus assembly protein PilX